MKLLTSPDWKDGVRNLKKQSLSDNEDGGFEVVPTERAVDDTKFGQTSNYNINIITAEDPNSYRHPH